MIVMDDFDKILTDTLPHLRRFAGSLTRNAPDAEDLTNDTVERLLKNRDKFEMGTNFKAWSFFIMRNQFYSIRRRAWRSVSQDDEFFKQFGKLDDPTWKMELDQVLEAISHLPVKTREALNLVAIDGFQYNEAAEMLGCDVGTVKSRVSRGRDMLETYFGA